MTKECHPTQLPRAVRCGIYEVDLHGGELRRSGLKVHLQDRPFSVLVRLLSSPGELVTREELQAQIWGENSRVDAELGLNTAIKKLRAAFNDSADNPRFIETLPKRGYRFIAPVREIERIPGAEPAGNLQPTGASNAQPAEAPNGKPTEASNAQPAEAPNGKPTEASNAQPAEAPNALPTGAPNALPTEASNAQPAEAPNGQPIEASNAQPAEAPKGQPVEASNAQPAETPNALPTGAPNARPAETPNAQPAETPNAQILGSPALSEKSANTEPLADRGLAVLHQAAKPRTPRTTGHKWLLVGGVLAFLGVIAGTVILTGRASPASGRSMLAGRMGVSVYRQPRGPDGAAMGIGGYNLRSPGDLAFAFDYGHTGKSDHLVFYRPGTGIIWILRNDNGRFRPAFVGHGIGGYALNSGADRVFAFDYDHTGKQDHLVLYRPGTERICILKNEGEGVFTPVYQHGDSDNSPPNMDAPSRSLAFDYAHTGKWDHLVQYRPGSRSLEILTNVDGKFSPVSTVSLPGTGGVPVGAAKPGADQLFAFDYDHSGKPDHLVLYQPGAGSAIILKNTGGTFVPVYESHSIRSAEIDSAEDRALPFDYQHTGSVDHLLLYRPGTGLFRVWKNTGGTLSPAYSGTGIGGYNLMSPNDRIVAFDYDHVGKLDYLTLYRPGTGLVQIVRLP